MSGDKRLGAVFIITQALLWGLFPILTTLSYGTIPPLFTGAMTMIFSSVFFAVMLTVRKRWHEVRRREAWRSIAIATVTIGMLTFLLNFIGIKYTSAGNVALLGQVEVLTTYLYVNVLRRHEQMHSMQFFGMIAMVLGTAVLLAPGVSVFMIGDLFIMLGNLLPPIGNVHMRRARQIVSSETILFFRSVGGGLFLLLCSMPFEPVPAPMVLLTALPLLAINGIVLMGITKILWIEGIHILGVSVARSLSCVMPAFTLIFANVILHQPITIYQVLAFGPMIIGAMLLTREPAGARTA